MIKKQYDFIIIGAGIAGCSVAYELKKHTDSILLIDRNSDVAQGASGAAGAFLSPLLGKPNLFKNLVTKSLKYSTSFYQKNAPCFIENCGTIRIPKDKKDEEKFQEYIPHMDFEYEQKEGGYFFKIGSVVDTYNTCKILIKDIETLFDFEVKELKYQDDIWKVGDSLEAKNLIITTGAYTELYNEEYFSIRAVWGQRIDINTTTCIDKNYHKECSVSKSTLLPNGLNKVSIGATHHRFVLDKKIDNNDTDTLLERANDIIQLDDVEVVDCFAGARASSVDYFPMVGNLIDSKKTLEEFPYLKNGTHVEEKRFTRYNNFYVLNGVGGRGFVLSPYLAKQLVENIFEDKKIDDEIIPDRLFKRWVKKQK